MRTIRSLFTGDFGALVVAAQIAAFTLVVTGCIDLEEISPVTTTSTSNGGSTSAGGSTSVGGATMTASGGSTSTAGAGGQSTGGTSTGGVGGVGGIGGTGGDTGTGGVVAQMVPDFSLVDMNTASPTAGEAVSPRDYLGKVSAWYFGHST